MRILYLHRHPYENGIGGITEFLHHLPPALKRLGIEVIFYHEGPLSGPHILQNGMPAYSGPFIKPSFFTRKKNLQPLIDICHNEKIDLIHAQGTYRSGYLAMQLHKHTNIPYIITSHSDIAPTNSDRIKRSKILRRCRNILKHATGVTHLSPVMADISNQIYDARDKSIMIGNGVDLADWQPYTTLPEQNYMLGIGRLEPEKGFHLLIDAYKKLPTTTSLIIAGSGSAESALHEQAKNLSVNVITDFNDFSAIPESSILFTGYVRGNTKKQLIAQSKLILFPVIPTLWEEAFGIVQIEAMAAGKAIIVGDSKTTRYMQSLGLQATFVQDSTPEQWATAIEYLLDNTEQRTHQGQTNLTNAKHFDWSIIAKQYRDFYITRY